MAEAEKDDWLDDLDSPEEKASELDQSDIDALLGPETPAAAATTGEDELELDQSAIDAMLSGQASPASDTSSELDQSDIDTLLASPKNTEQDQPAIEPDQDEIDKLFSEIDSIGTNEENSFPAEEVDFKDVFDSTDTPSNKENLDFDAEEFKLDADIPDIPDTQGLGDLGGAPSFLDDTVANSLFAEEPAPPPPTKEPKKEKQAPMKPPAQEYPAPTGNNRLRSKKMLIALGCGLTVVLLLGGYFFIKSRAKTASHPPPSVVVQQPTAKPHEESGHNEPPAVPSESSPKPAATPQHHAANAAPTVTSLELTMPPDSSQLEITISGADPENDLLQYVMSMPEHGQLSGQPPNLIYTAKPDFSGKDGFIIRATDGKNISTPATVVISRQQPVPAKEHPPLEAAKSEHKIESSSPESEKSQQEIILAKNRTYTLTGTKGQVINWEKIWRDAANLTAYNADVRVDIVKAPRHGSLKTINNRQSIYLPNNAFKGTDSITYRFKLGELTSASKTVTVSVHRKNKAPVIHLQPIATTYTVGDKVVLNASQTADDHRDEVTFQWEQLSGPQVLIKPLNSVGSQIAFVVPSTFNTVDPSALVVRLTATDKAGAKDTKEIKITTKSRRNSAIWH